LPLARMGFHVKVTDIDALPLLRAQNKARLPGIIGSISTRLSDVTEELPIEDGSLDGILNAGLGYLMPPKQLGKFFGKMTDVLRPGGVIVLEMATDRERRPFKGSEDSLIGKDEYNYNHEEGLALVKKLFAQHGFKDFAIREKEINLEEPYYLHNNLIIASGIKR